MFRDDIYLFSAFAVTVQSSCGDSKLILDLPSKTLSSLNLILKA